jgi:predicted O-methyltransferase YrrM
MNKDLAKPWTQDSNFISLADQFNKIHNVAYDINSSLYKRLYVLYSIAKQQRSLGGDFAECGVFAGMSVFFTAGFCNARYVALDSFEGLSKPVKNDGEHFSEFDLRAPIEVAQKTLNRFENVYLIKGWIPESFNELEESEYSFVNIDVDLYEPTKDSIEYFWPKVMPGGVLICDDYGSEKTPGAKIAIDEYFFNYNIETLDTGQAIIFKPTIDF